MIAFSAQNARQQVGLGLEVTLNCQVLNDPHVVSLRVESRSRRDIRGADFEDDMPLTLDLGTPILNLLALDTGGRGMPDVKVETKRTTVAIGPGLVKRGQTIILNLLTDGPVSLTCPNPQLADVIVKERRPDIGLDSVGLGGGAVALAGAVLIAAIADGIKHLRTQERSRTK